MKHDPAELIPLDWRTLLLALSLVMVPLLWFIKEWL